MRFTSAICLGFSASLMAMTPCQAQLPRIPDQQSGLDLVQLASGQRLYGFILEESPVGDLRLAVERDWLQRTYPELFQEQSLLEHERLSQARAQLLSRTAAWLDERDSAQDEALRSFLESELSRIRNGTLQSQRQRTFMVLYLDGDELRESCSRPYPLRHIAGLAYQFGLDQVVTSRVTALQNRLEQMGIDPQTEVVDLTSEVPAWQPQTARCWAAKQALVEYQLRGELEYQGVSYNWVRKQNGAVDATALLREMILGGTPASSQLDAVMQLGADLGLPEFQHFSEQEKTTEKARAVAKVTREAEQDGFRGVLLTSLQQSVLKAAVTVETVFLAQEQPGTWFVVFRSRAMENTQVQSVEHVEQLKRDPQVEQAVDALARLGLDVGDRLDQALRHGVATQRAIERAKGELHRYLARSARAIDGMPVTISSSHSRSDSP